MQPRMEAKPPSREPAPPEAGSTCAADVAGGLRDFMTDAMDQLMGGVRMGWSPAQCVSWCAERHGEDTACGLVRILLDGTREHPKVLDRMMSVLDGIGTDHPGLASRALREALAVDPAWAYVPLSLLGRSVLHDYPGHVLQTTDAFRKSEATHGPLTSLTSAITWTIRTLAFKGIPNPRFLDFHGRRWLDALPNGLKADVLSLKDCPHMTSLPAGLDITGSIDLRGCLRWDGKIPDDARIGGLIYTYATPAGARMEAYRAWEAGEAPIKLPKGFFYS